MEDLKKKLVDFENALLDYTDNQYNEDDELEVAREINLRAKMYTALEQLRVSIYDAACQIDIDRHAADKKIKELSEENEQLRNKVSDMSCHVERIDLIRVEKYTDDPDWNRFALRVSENHLNERLATLGVVTLRDVYEALGVEPIIKQPLDIFGWGHEHNGPIQFEIFENKVDGSFIVGVHGYGFLNQT